jgi:hypothetical protein
VNQVISRLLHPERVFSRDEVLARPSAVPSEPGIYAWYFRQPPSPLIDLGACWNHAGLWLLYVGISPSEPPRDGGEPSKNNLRKRIQGHMRGNASGSTLRLSLGCLLSDELGIELRRVGRTGRCTFSTKEQILSDWMQNNAFVTWEVHPEPWVVEREAVPSLYLPLNLDMNKGHPFYATLSGVRRGQKQLARQKEVLPR